jgi:hypothetical protein
MKFAKERRPRRFARPLSGLAARAQAQQPSPTGGGLQFVQDSRLSLALAAWIEELAVYGTARIRWIRDRT